MRDDKSHYVACLLDMTSDCVTEPCGLHLIIQSSGHRADTRDTLQSDFILLKWIICMLRIILTLILRLSFCSYMK